VDAVAEGYLARLAELDPVLATFFGLPEHADQVTDYSPAGHDARADLARNSLRELAGVRAVDDVDRVTVAALGEHLRRALQMHDAGLDAASLNNLDCPVQYLREVFDIAASDTADDWEAIADRLHAVPAALDGYRRSLLRAVDRGWKPPVRQVNAAARQAAEFGAPGGFFTSFAAQARLRDGEPPAGRLAERLAQGAARVARAYTELDGLLRADLLPVARQDDAVGPEVYAIAASSFLGTEPDLAETYRWGQEELNRIEARMAQVSRGILPDHPASGHDLIIAAQEHLDADPARRIEGTDAFRAWMQELSDHAVEALADVHFSIPAPLHRLVCRIAPSTAGGVYYTGPTEDFSRPGQMWWSVPAEVTSFSTWRETSTVYHEGVPGHHLQIGQAVYRSDRLNRWRRMGSWVSGYGEGWALYAERLMDELGYLSDPGDQLGMLDSHALRASRVVVDIGVHLRLEAPDEVGGGRWDADKAWAFLSTHTRLPEPNRRFELERYLGWPGQAISYKVGERVWLDLRDELAAREGAAFDLRAFHARGLDLGSVGLDVLRRALLDEAAPADHGAAPADHGAAPADHGAAPADGVASGA
jgi:uncharacterized protein (DUF885 family)